MYAGPGSSFGLGCTFAHPCSDTHAPPAGGSTSDTVGGNVTLDYVFNAAINGDTIGGNLICGGNSPANQVGDSEGSPNTVGKHALGQCAGLTG